MADDYTTNMKSVLTNLKELYKDYLDGTLGTTLNKVKTFKRGVLGEKTVYPAITVFPVRELIVQRRNNHKQVVERTVNTEMYFKGYTPQSSERLLLSYEEYIRNIFYDSSYPTNYKLVEGARPTVYNFEIDKYEFNNTDADIIQSLIIPIKFYSLETAPSYTISAQVAEETKDIGDLLLFTFKADNDLNNVKFFYNNTIPPIPVVSGPSICIKEVQSQDAHSELGRDTEVREFNISVWSKLSPYEGVIDNHLDTVEALKNTLHENTMWGGKSWYSYISRIEHGVNSIKLMYGTQINYIINTWRVLPTGY